MARQAGRGRDTAAEPDRPGMAARRRDPGPASHRAHPRGREGEPAELAADNLAGDSKIVAANAKPGDIVSSSR